jgi:hypothetical protein
MSTTYNYRKKGLQSVCTITTIRKAADVPKEARALTHYYDVRYPIDGSVQNASPKREASAPWNLVESTIREVFSRGEKTYEFISVFHSYDPAGMAALAAECAAANARYNGAQA